MQISEKLLEGWLFKFAQTFVVWCESTLNLHSFLMASGGDVSGDKTKSDCMRNVFS